MKTSKGFFMLKKKLKGYKEITILKKKSEKKTGTNRKPS